MSTLFLFNPTNEMAIADGGNGFIPSRYLAAFERDIETLPFLFADVNDIILVADKPEKEWTESFDPANRAFPRFMNKAELMAGLKNKTIVLKNICPWGWSPRTLKIVEDFLTLSADIDRSIPNFSWSAMHKEMYGRATALGTLKHIAETFDKRKLLIDNDLFPCKTDNISEIEEQITKNKAIVVKSPHSSSGRGILMLSEPTLNRSNRDWIQRAILQSGYVMVEPKLDVITEFSMQFRIDNLSCRYLAFGSFNTNSKGGYEGNFVGGFEASSEVATFLKQIEIPQLAHITASALLKQNIGSFYHGFLGVDLLLCRNREGGLFIHPCSEINTRQNMGLVAHYLSKWLAPGSFGLFRILRKSDFEKNSFRQLLEQNQPQWENHLLKKGIQPLTPENNRQQVAILEVYEKSSVDNVLWFSDYRG